MDIFDRSTPEVRRTLLEVMQHYVPKAAPVARRPVKNKKEIKESEAQPVA